MTEFEFGVVCVDSNIQRASEIQALFTFMEVPIEVVSSTAIVSDAQDSIRQKIVLIGYDSGHKTFHKVMDQLGNESPPLILYVGAPENTELPAFVKSRIYQSLPYPLAFNQLRSTLRRVQMGLVSNHPASVGSTIDERLVGESLEIRHIRDMIRRVGGRDVSVMITGESGTGKEVAARAIHAISNRRNRLFVPVNCGAIPAELLESELFGHEKGAFTGAIATRVGRFEMAEGGTLFLDEIGDMPLAMQVKLLRVLQEKTFERVGSNKTLQADVRIIAATHQDLEKQVAEGRFREDLYYRLNVFPIEMPALRQRKMDIPLLINAFLSAMELEKRESVRLSVEAIRVLAQYDWPGNVRELSNIIERLSVLYPDERVDVHHLPEKYRQGIESTAQELDLHVHDVSYRGVCVHCAMPMGAEIEEPIDLKVQVTELEKRLILKALNQTDGVVARAAKLVGLQRTTMVEKIKKLQIDRISTAS